MNDPPVSVEVVRLSRKEGEPFVAVTVRLSGGDACETRVLVIREEAYRRLKPAKGQISRGLFDAIEKEARVCDAMRRGAGILGYGANSKNALARKLRRRGFDEETAQTAVGQLAGCGYINESNDAVALAQRGAAKLWGERRIIASLYEKGYRDEAIAEAREALSRVDFAGSCLSVIRKKYGNAFPVEKNERSKAVSALLRLGFSSSDIREALRRLASGNCQ